MSVVRRCPSCGTTKPTAGECDACHEAEVRLFCTNHTPGLWLDADTCPECGARLGDPARSAAPAYPAPPRAAPPRAAPSSASARPRSTRPERVRASPRSPTPYTDAGPREDELEARPSRLAPWQKVLLAALRARYVPTRGARARELPAVGHVAGGCLKRLLLVVVLMLIALAGAVFLFGRALLQTY